MRKLIILSLLSFLCFPSKAENRSEQQMKDAAYSDGYFNHLGIGASVGTDGIGLDLATPITDLVAIRTGVSIWPKFGISKNIHITDNNPSIADEVTIEGKPNIFDFKLLADLYPFKSSSFHITAGLFVGKEIFVKATNTTMFIKDPAKYGKLGLMVGDYRIVTDDNGYILVDAKSNRVKPYIGIGFGRAVPRKHRFSVSCDFGVKIWGKPGTYAWTINDWGDKTYHKFSVDDLDEYDDKSIKDAIEIIDKIAVFPVLNIRISGRIF